MKQNNSSRRFRTIQFLLAAMLLSSSLGFAQDKAKKAGDVQYKKTTEYSFDDDTIEGDLSRPDGEYVEARKQVKHSNLIKIRNEFKDKVMQSVGEL
jgi:hypothetical protein